MTPRGVGLSLSVVLLWVAARSFGIPELQMAAVGCVVLVAAGVIWSVVIPTRIGVERTVIPVTVWFEGEATARLVVRNTGRLTTPPMLLRDGVPDSLTAGSTIRLGPIAPGSRSVVTYRLHGRQRGRFALGPVTLICTDPFGIVSRTRTLPAPGVLTVYPPVWHLPAGLPLGGSSASGQGGRRRSSTSGDDPGDIREYVRGDDLRSVHWPSTAHRGRLMVRRSETNRSPSAVVLVDRRAQRHVGHGTASSFESAIAVAASAGHHLALRGRSVILLDAPVARPPRPLPWESWLERLAETTPATIDMQGLLRQVGEGIAGDGTLVAILTVPDPAELRSLVRAGRGFTTRAAVIIDTASHGGTGRRDVAASAVAASLRAAGWRATVVARGDRIDDRWSELATARRVSSSTATSATADGAVG